MQDFWDDELSVFDIMCICKISAIHEKNKELQYSFNDILTGKPIKIDSERDNSKRIEKALFYTSKDYIEKTRTIPSHVVLIGEFFESEDDPNSIYWNVDSICMFTFLDLQVNACYVELHKKEHFGIFKDVLTDKIVAVPEGDAGFMKSVIDLMAGCSIGKYDYSKDSLNCALFIGQIQQIDSEKIFYKYNSNFLFGDYESVYEYLASMILRAC